MQDRLPSAARRGADKHDPTETEALQALSRLDASQACASIGSSIDGLTDIEATARLRRYGPNLLSREHQPSIGRVLWQHIRNPLNALLILLAGVSYASGASPDGAFTEVPIETLVPGDIVSLSAGDMIPGDLRLIDAKDLFVNQSVLTGESIPQERFAHAAQPTGADPFELSNIGFMGANVVSGYGTGLIVRTGANTFFGALSEQVAGDRPTTAFDTGIARFTWMMIGFITVMAPAVFLINGLTKHDWLQAFMFAVAVAVGLTPELLPMIVTVNLAKGALAMSRAKVIVKHLGAIQNLGAMNILCTDKTGTLDASHFDAAQAQTRTLNQDGFRVVALAFKAVPQAKATYSVADESELTLLGFIAFLDPPKESARQALSALADKGVTVKILTGDNEIVTAKVCREVGLEPGTIVMGGQIDAMSDETLADLAERSSVFAKLTPAHKARIVGVLRARHHVVGFMGDGITRGDVSLPTSPNTFAWAQARTSATCSACSGPA